MKLFSSVMAYLFKPRASILESLGIATGSYLMLTTDYILTGFLIVVFTPITQMVINETIEKVKNINIKH